MLRPPRVESPERGAAGTRRTDDGIAARSPRRTRGGTEPDPTFPSTRARGRRFETRSSEPQRVHRERKVANRRACVPRSAVVRGLAEHARRARPVSPDRGSAPGEPSPACEATRRREENSIGRGGRAGSRRYRIPGGKNERYEKRQWRRAHGARTVGQKGERGIPVQKRREARSGGRSDSDWRAVPVTERRRAGGPERRFGSRQTTRAGGSPPPACETRLETVRLRGFSGEAARFQKERLRAPVAPATRSARRAPQASRFGCRPWSVSTGS